MTGNGKKRSLAVLICLVMACGICAAALADYDPENSVEFSRDGFEYVMPGGTEVPLTDVLSALDVNGDVTDVYVSNDSLFSVSLDKGEWFITSHQGFSSEEWINVTVNGEIYDITVTESSGTASAEP